MGQNINLFNAAFSKPKRALSFAMLVKCLGLTLVVLLALQFYLLYAVSGLTGKLRSVEGSLKEQRAHAETQTGTASARKPDAQVEAEIAQLEVELKQAQEAIGALRGGEFGDEQGFAEYLRAFSRQSVDGLWLTGFVITASGELELRGRVLRPDLVPSYIQRLSREEVFAGRSFARFEMSRPEGERAADKQGERGADKQGARAPGFLEFSLATTEAGKKAERTQ
jgi:hypothetical protein